MHFQATHLLARMLFRLVAFLPAILATMLIRLGFLRSTLWLDVIFVLYIVTGVLLVYETSIVGVLLARFKRKNRREK